MKRRVLQHWLTASAAFACLGNALPCAAQEWLAAPPPPPGFRLGVGLLWQYDTNVQRLASDTGADSLIYGASVLAGFDQTYGRQHVYAAADVGRVLYSQFPLYNYTQENLTAGWHMNLPASVDAEVDLAHTVQLARFADLNSTRRDVITGNDARAFVDFPVLVEQWRLVVGGDASRLRHSAGTDQQADSNTAELDAGVRYQTDLGNRVDLLARTVHANYPDAQASSLGNCVPGPRSTCVSPYRDRGADLRVQWKFSGASTLSGRVGYVKRRYDLRTFSDFAGAAYDMTYLWQPTVRTSLAFLVLRQMGATGDNQYQSAVTHTYRVTPAYALTEKIHAEVQFELDQLDYLAVGNASSRRDRVHSARIGMAWLPRSWLQIKLSQTVEQRASNLATFDYLDHLSSLSLQATF
jgi:hypothetical protein